MTLEQQELLFRPFTQADTSMSRKFGGTGLGLTISKRLSEILGGGLSILDSKPNVGTRFEAWISATEVVVSRLEDHVLSPSASKLGSDGLREKTFVNSSTSSGESTVPLRLDGLRILLAEDGVDNQRLISHILKKAGGNVTVAENGRMAIEATHTAKALGQPFDIILMDMQMPVLDGYQSATELRTDGYGGVIIALTAHAMSGDREKCVAAGCNDYTTKPINRSELIFMIASYCQDKISSSN
jgi:CheY-like chemotaxis protein